MCNPKFAGGSKISTRPAAVLKRGNDPNGLNSSGEKLPPTPRTAAAAPAVRKKSKKLQLAPEPPAAEFLDEKMPGSIAAAQREQSSLKQRQRKMRIAHYGRTPANLRGHRMQQLDSSPDDNGGEPPASQAEKRCSFITSNSDPLCVAYHDQEWGVPVHDDKLLFELLVMSGFRVELDWTTILKKRTEFRSAFAGFEVVQVSKFTEKQMSSISSDYGLDLVRVRGVVDNAKKILEVKEETGNSLDNFFWGFVNHKPLSPGYKSCRKIPAKTSKSESISKELLRRGFRFAGPTVVHSFMQATGITNDHLISCPRRRHLLSLIH
ncbi:DNA-3-methyladenine glycosylase I [Apostasia shenzhenica]|uniref:DNA-3-methyladenine glycosylase I n=1 Tax=Apostasia shenzhenica TaxID=1088818 RepID=A0A2H9ZTR0_9ASPA|nr:DNA-3-methyladenine glycosylase I [Apostasia shenzhenica]